MSTPESLVTTEASDEPTEMEPVVFETSAGMLVAFPCATACGVGGGSDTVPFKVPDGVQTVSVEATWQQVTPLGATLHVLVFGKDSLLADKSCESPCTLTVDPWPDGENGGFAVGPAMPGVTLDERVRVIVTGT